MTFILFACPTESTIIEHRDCDSTYILLSPFDNVLNGQEYKFTTDEMIIGQNKIQNRGQLILDAKNGVEFRPGFVVDQNGRIEVLLDGCQD